MLRDIVAAMDRYVTTLNAFLAGIGGAFALFPSGQLDRYLERDSVESRVYSNFVRVGARLDSATSKVRDEQEKRTKSAAR